MPSKLHSQIQQTLDLKSKLLIQNKKYISPRTVDIVHILTLQNTIQIILWFDYRNYYLLIVKRWQYPSQFDPTVVNVLPGSPCLSYCCSQWYDLARKTNVSPHSSPTRQPNNTNKYFNIGQVSWTHHIYFIIQTKSLGFQVGVFTTCEPYWLLDHKVIKLLVLLLIWVTMQVDTQSRCEQRKRMPRD